MKLQKPQIGPKHQMSSLEERRNVHHDELISFASDPLDNFKKKIPSPRGVLALLVSPTQIVDVSSEGANVSKYFLRYYPQNVNPKSRYPVTTRRQRRRFRRNAGSSHLQDEEECINCNSRIINHQKLDFGITFQPHKSEFTLFYFCDSTCRHSTRFVPIFGRFVRNLISVEEACETNRNIEKCENRVHPFQCICVPNDLCFDRNGQHSKPKSEILTRLSNEMDFWHLGFNHVNRLALIRLLSISMVPTLVVVNNSTGRIVTDWGVQAVESYEMDPKEAYEAWKLGRSGVPLIARVTSSCSIS